MDGWTLLHPTPFPLKEINISTSNCNPLNRNEHNLKLLRLRAVLPARGSEQGGFQHVGFAAGQLGWQKAEDEEDADAG